MSAAEDAIAEHGLGNLRARALAETVGCSVGAIYGVFPDLEALVLSVNGRTLDAIDQVMRTATSNRGAVEHLVRLADAYLDYADNHRQRWRALFQHVSPEGRPVAPWFAQSQAAAFAHVEEPLLELAPDLTPDDRALLARSLFSAVHGMVALGLDEKVVAMPLPVLRAQIRLVVEAIARGLMRAPAPDRA